MHYTATYSPDDNKLRLYASSRLPDELYQRIKAAGFKWAPKQDLFFAPMWTPEREELLIELAGDIEDEDKSLTARAEERAERFEQYSENRAADADGARKAVAAIADGIPLGQPILIGHHSEKHARRDAEKIENGMRRAVKMWETSKYWTERAAGAIANAKYKERPDVRARRIKVIEADLRRVERSTKEAELFSKMWRDIDTPGAYKKDGAPISKHEAALYVANHDHVSRCFPLAEYPREAPASQYEGAMSLWSALDGGVINADQARDLALGAHDRGNVHRAKWAAHYQNRLAYERAMLADAGGLASDRAAFAVGGRVLRKGQWFVILRVNRESVTVSGHWGTTITHDEISDYRPPSEEEAAKVKKLAKLPPLCNYPGEGFKHLTRAELDARPERRWSDFPKIGTLKATATRGAHRVQQCRGETQWSSGPVFITDEKRKDPPALVPDEERPSLAPERVQPKPQEPAAVSDFFAGHPEVAKANAESFEAMKESLRHGVQVVSATQLFPTPAPIASRMVELADVAAGHRILEPSAGTGELLAALARARVDCKAVAVEINGKLAENLRARFMVNVDTRCADFLACNGDLGAFDRVLMNPPFANAADIKHVQHAASMLKPGGRLVGICANGPRQNEILRPMVEDAGGLWEELPADTFRGTGVRAVLFTYDKAEDL